MIFLMNFQKRPQWSVLTTCLIALWRDLSFRWILFWAFAFDCRRDSLHGVARHWDFWTDAANFSPRAGSLLSGNYRHDTTEVLLAVNRQGQSLCAADHPTSLRDHLVLFGPASEVQASQWSKHVKASERSYPWLENLFFLWENIG